MVNIERSMQEGVFGEGETVWGKVKKAGWEKLFGVGKNKRCWKNCGERKVLGGKKFVKNLKGTNVGRMSKKKFGKMYPKNLWENFGNKIVEKFWGENCGKIWEKKFWENFGKQILGEVRGKNFGKISGKKMLETFQKKKFGKISKKKFWENFKKKILGKCQKKNFGKMSKKKFGKISKKKFWKNSPKKILGKFPKKKFSTKKIFRGGFRGGPVVLGGVGWGMNLRKVKRKLCGNKFGGGGEVLVEFSTQTECGETLFGGGGPFRKSLGGPLRSGAPGCISWASTYPPSPPNKIWSGACGSMGPGLPPPQQGWASLQWGWEGGGFVGESSKSCVGGGEQRFGGK